MFWTKEECQEWLPFVQAVAEGKEYSTDHCYVDGDGNVYASAVDTEYSSCGNILPIIRHNHTMIEPRVYLRIKE